MFVRVTSTPKSPRKSVKVVASFREGYKVKQKMIFHVGIANTEEEIEKLKKLGYEYIARAKKEHEKNSGQTNLFSEQSLEDVANLIEKYAKENATKKGRKSRVSLEKIIPTSEVNIDQIIETKRVVEGIDEICGKVYDDLGYNNILKKNKDKSLLKDLVLSRIAVPASKNKTQKILLKQFNKEYDLDRIYRLLDKLHPNIGNIKKITFNGTLSLVPEKVDVLLFDVTTLYFESENNDELREFGYSKDHRFNTTQVVLALATNRDGLPIGYELFKGNKAEVGTLCESINSWRQHFDIGSVCFVGDRAMMSRKNVQLLENLGHNYIIAAKLRSMPISLKKQILDGKNYKATQFGDELGWIGEFDYESKRLIVSYKKTRAQHDAEQRQKIIDKLKKSLGAVGKTKKLITNHGVRKYTTTTSDSETIIDNDKIARDSEMDGLHGVITNIKEESVFSILAHYSRLWVIEESFRINKHSLSMRPIYHFKKERIESHIALCYMAFATLRHLQYKISITTKISPEQIIEELFDVQASIYIHKETGNKYRIPGHFSHAASKIYKSLNIIRKLDAVPYN